jgi:diadenosine tetraphosphatase ApaH/serine/threonine PP2A family protein phosphatase
MFAILSDIHANLEALTAVLADIDRHGVERIVCLGDRVGYGPDPVACIDIIRERCEAGLMGNFEHLAVFDPDRFSDAPRRVYDWLRQLDGYERRQPYLAELPPSHHEGGFLYVHGSARDPLHEYVFPENIHDQRKMGRIFDLIPHVCFCGHTHIQGVIVDRAGRYDSKTRKFYPTGGAGEYAYFAPEEVGHEWRLDACKTIINVGSVGQPRDLDPRAGYVLVEGELVRFRRVEYDVETTIRKIRDIPDLDDMDGDRLRDGR